MQELEKLLASSREHASGSPSFKSVGMLCVDDDGDDEGVLQPPPNSNRRASSVTFGEDPPVVSRQHSRRRSIVMSLDASALTAGTGAALLHTASGNLRAPSFTSQGASLLRAASFSRARRETLTNAPLYPQPPSQLPPPSLPVARRSVVRRSSAYDLLHPGPASPTAGSNSNLPSLSGVAGEFPHLGNLRAHSMRQIQVTGTGGFSPMSSGSQLHVANAQNGDGVRGADDDWGPGSVGAVEPAEVVSGTSVGAGVGSTGSTGAGTGRFLKLIKGMFASDKPGPSEPTSPLPSSPRAAGGALSGMSLPRADSRCPSREASFHTRLPGLNPALASSPCATTGAPPHLAEARAISSSAAHLDSPPPSRSFHRCSSTTASPLAPAQPPAAGPHAALLAAYADAAPPPPGGSSASAWAHTLEPPAPTPPAVRPLASRSTPKRSVSVSTGLGVTQQQAQLLAAAAALAGDGGSSYGQLPQLPSRQRNPAASAMAALLAARRD
ncbi:hypothetical protein HYH03_000689 [Edaphochlamys debaryana]|uniref:Uncharacterized protein n=1 Tax=Edaphochlamys debaryana TaxID=47281 RepID=A0A835YGC2_9CHLO|nr:hypothetical protein HYH03_000689 [Edaphochlamys debaryana]|eukprot:KAG2502203.1 hypothetical protein HYH03_000689 [Edaphochlamys debaryana]